MTVYLQLTPPFLSSFPLSFTSPRTPTIISLRLQKHCFLASKTPVCLESLEQAQKKLPFVCVCFMHVCVRACFGVCQCVCLLMFARVSQCVHVSVSMCVRAFTHVCF